MKLLLFLGVVGMTTASVELGRLLGAMSNEQNLVRDNLSGNESSGAIGVYNSEELVAIGTIVGNERTIVGVMIVGHPVYGEVNSYPVFMPIVLGHPIWGVLGEGYLDGTVFYSYVELVNKSI